MSARLYFCTDEPTWKVISLPVPPRNLPSIRLPFFSSKESAHVIDAARQNPMTNPQFSLNFMMTSPLPGSGFGKSSYFYARPTRWSRATELPSGDPPRTGIVKVAPSISGTCQDVGTNYAGTESRQSRKTLCLNKIAFPVLDYEVQLIWDGRAEWLQYIIGLRPSRKPKEAHAWPPVYFRKSSRNH